MPTLEFRPPGENHQLNVGDRQLAPGDTFEVSEEDAEILLASPSGWIVSAKGSTPTDDVGGSQSPPSGTAPQEQDLMGDTHASRNR